MNRTRFLLSAAACLALVAGANAQPASKDTKPAAKAPAAAQPQLPPGMSEADMKACMDAATPGKAHEHLAKTVGTWSGKNKMWMAPGTEPIASECTATVTSVMDGRFTKCEVSGDMPGMGPFNGFGLSGFDNVSQKYQTTWVDNMGTGMMTGTGSLSADGKTLSWNLTYNCPMTKKVQAMRQVETITGKDTMTLEMFGPDRETGKEFKMMEISYTRKAGAAAPATNLKPANKPGTDK